MTIRRVAVICTCIVLALLAWAVRLEIREHRAAKEAEQRENGWPNNYMCLGDSRCYPVDVGPQIPQTSNIGPGEEATHSWPDDSCDDDAMQTAILRKIMPVLGDGNAYESYDQKQLNYYDEKIACMKSWVHSKESHLNSCAANHYDDWLNWYSGQVATGRANLISPHREDAEREEYDKKERERDKLVKKYEASVPSPDLKCHTSDEAEVTR